MVDPTKETETPVTEESKTPDPKLLDAVSDLISEVKDLRSQGKEEEVQQVARQVGWTPEDLAKMIDGAQEQGGTVGQGTAQAIQTVSATMAASMLDRDGKREVASLGNQKKFAKTFNTEKDESVFDTFSSGFRSWLNKSQIQYSTLADPERAEQMFNYYLANHTDYHDKVREKDIETAKAAERKRIEEEGNLRGRKPVPASLPAGAKPEGGVGSRLVHAAIGSGDEPTENQTAIMDALGFDEEKQQKAMEAHAGKTAMGTPLTFVKTRNEGAVD